MRHFEVLAAALCYCAVACGASTIGNYAWDGGSGGSSDSLVVGGVSAKARPFFSQVVLRLVDGGDFVELASGNPPRLIKLRLDFSSSAVVVYEALAQRSQTFAAWNSSVTSGIDEGSEIFYFEHYKVRLPFRFGVSSESTHTALYHSTTHSGALGLGRRSPLWRYWRSFVLSEDTLVLGGSATAEFSEPIALGSAHDVTAETTLSAAAGVLLPQTHTAVGSERVATPATAPVPPTTNKLSVRIATHVYDTSLPDPYFLAPYTTLWFKHDGGGGDDDTLSFQLDEATHVTRLASGFVYKALRRVPPNAVATLGLSALRHHVVHIDIANNTARFAPAIGARATAPTLLVLAALLILSALAYLLLQLDASVQNSAASAVAISANNDDALCSGTQLLRAYAHLCALLVVAVALGGGADMRRLVSHFSHANPVAVLLYAGVSAIIGAVLALVPVVSAPIVLIAACAPAAWLALLPYGDVPCGGANTGAGSGGAGTLMLVLVSGASSTALAISALNIIYGHASPSRGHRRHWRPHALDIVVRLAAAAVAQVAFVFLNAYELVGLDVRDHAVQAVGGAVLLWAAAVATPSFFLYAAKEIQPFQPQAPH